MSDIVKERLSGSTCTTSRGKEIIWSGHLCEGANLTPPRDDNFCLWTRCGRHDVPAGAAHEGSFQEVECEDCSRVWKDENGQFGVGA